MRCAFSWLSCPASSGACLAGGDIASAAQSPSAIRLLVGDVMGHGPRAARTSAEVTRAFGELARRDRPLHEIALGLDTFLASRNTMAGGGYFADEFVTALIISVPRDPGAGAEIVSCGHPAPLLFHGPRGDRRATPVDPLPPAPPLSLLDLADCPALPVPLQVAPGESLLLYTDGVTDARDALGRPFPLADRAPVLADQIDDLADGPAHDQTGTALLHALRVDLLRHAGGKLADDATMLLVDFDFDLDFDLDPDSDPGRPRDHVPYPAVHGTGPMPRAPRSIGQPLPLVPAVPRDSLLSEAADRRGSILG